jgi:hypothetical protein
MVARTGAFPLAPSQSMRKSFDNFLKLTLFL